MSTNLAANGIQNNLKRNSKFWVFQMVGWGVLGLLIYSIMIVQTSTPGITLSQKLVFSGFGFLLTIPLYIVYSKFWRNFQWNWAKLISIIIFSSMTAAGLWLLACEFFVLRHDAGTIIQLFTENPGLIAEYYFHQIVIMLSWSSIFIGFLLLRDLQTQKKQNLITHHLLDKAKLQALRYQLNPHFLFNVLNSIHSVIHSEPKKAEKMVEELSDLLRYTLVKYDDQTVTLEEEVSIINSYLSIEKIRFGEKLSVEMDVDLNAQKIQIPALMILTLVENAVKHGMKSSDYPLRLSIYIDLDNENVLRIKVSNTGFLEPPTSNGLDSHVQRSKIGLQNIRDRLQQHYGTKSNLVLYEDSGWVHVKMKITDVNTN